MGIRCRYRWHVGLGWVAALIRMHTYNEGNTNNTIPVVTIGISGTSLFSTK